MQIDPNRSLEDANRPPIGKTDQKEG
ncbi:unnamed protein product, partial [Brachionus calyciflorus]